MVFLWSLRVEYKYLTVWPTSWVGMRFVHVYTIKCIYTFLHLWVQSFSHWATTPASSWLSVPRDCDFHQNFLFHFTPTLSVSKCSPVSNTEGFGQSVFLKMTLGDCHSHLQDTCLVLFSQWKLDTMNCSLSLLRSVWTVTTSPDLSKNKHFVPQSSMTRQFHTTERFSLRKCSLSKCSFTVLVVEVTEDRLIIRHLFCLLVCLLGCRPASPSFCMPGYRLLQ